MKIIECKTIEFGMTRDFIEVNSLKSLSHLATYHSSFFAYKLDNKLYLIFELVVYYYNYNRGKN